MAITNKSKTDENQKDFWRTPPELIQDALQLLGIESFDTDVCCTDSSIKIEKAETYISEEEDALNNDAIWFLTGASNTSFCNPPFSKKWQFFLKAVEQVNQYWHSVLMVMPYTPCTRDWHENVHSTNCIIYVPDGRYNFLTKEGKLPERLNKKTGRIEKSSPDFAVVLILIVPFLCGNVIINYQRGLK